MTNLNSTHKITAAAVFGAAALFSMLSFGSNAEAAQGLSRCQGGTVKAVVSCCDMLTKAQRPLWMVQTRSSCKEVVVCAGKQNSDRRCYVRITHKQNDGGDKKEGGDPGPNSTRSSQF
ncbi:MAG: hypothetical protein ABL936_25425 [Aestuariivirga sp.]